MNSLTAEVRLRTRLGKQYVELLCNDFEKDEIETAATPTGAQVHLPRGLGTAHIDVDAHELVIRAEAATEQGLSALKFILGLRLERAAEAENPDLAWTGHGCDLTVLPNFREIRVARIDAVTPLVRRITFTGRDLHRLAGDGIHIRLLFPPAGLDQPEWPRPGKNGRPVWPPVERRPATRVYTIRRIDLPASEIDVDFVLHGEHGTASGWAAKAGIGDVVGMLGPSPADLEAADWYLIAGDETAIPAIARMFEAMPRQARGHAVIEVADADEIQALTPPPGIELTWLLRAGRPAGDSDLLAEAALAITPPALERVRCWLGAEAQTARRLRHHWREVLHLPKDQVSAVAYWHRGEAGH